MEALIIISHFNNRKFGRGGGGSRLVRVVGRMEEMSIPYDYEAK